MMDSKRNESIDLSQTLVSQLSSLYMNEKDSDFVFIIENERIFAHKFILCLRCEYFRVMFSSGLREAILNEVEVKETPLSAFKDVLYFMYSGRMLLQNKKIDDILDILFLGHHYGMHELVEAVTENLESHINEDNVCDIHATASLFSLVPLVDRCQEFIRCNGYKLLSNSSIMNVLPPNGHPILDPKTVIELFSSDNFCAEEIDVFNAVVKYTQKHLNIMDDESYEKLVATVRLPLISWNDLIAYVWPSGLFARDQLLAAMEYRKSDGLDNYGNYRKCCEPIMNLRSIAGYVVEKTVLHCHTYAQNLSVIVKVPGSFTIAFDTIRFINYLELGFGNCKKTGYSYYIEVLIDDRWQRIVDYTDYKCHSTQYLYFGKTPAKSIRVHCTHCHSGGTNFIMDAFKCMLKDPPHLYNSARNKTDLDYSSLNINKLYAPLYGPKLDFSSRARPSAKKVMIKS